MFISEKIQFQRFDSYITVLIDGLILLHSHTYTNSIRHSVLTRSIAATEKNRPNIEKQFHMKQIIFYLKLRQYVECELKIQFLFCE